MLETLGFSGSYLSVSVTLPDAARDGLTRAHIIRLDVTLTGRDADADAAIRATDGRTGASTADREFCWFDIPLFR